RRLGLRPPRDTKPAMAGEFRVFGLIGRRGDSRVAESLRALIDYLSARGHEVLLEQAIGDELTVASIERLPGPELASRADLAIAVGGDGTMLYAARTMASHGVPLLGVNRGRLGFLADIGPNEMLDRLDEVLAGDVVHDDRLMVQASLERESGETLTATGLNDIVVQKSDVGRMLEFETRMNGRFVNNHGGDGLIVATPTGSTAYALSGGGPILEPSLNALALVPISPHTLSDRPVVVDASTAITVRILDRGHTQAQLVADGQLVADLDPSDTLRVSAAPQRARLLHPRGYDYYKILRSKLAWGRGSTGRNRRAEP
ncbi:MAG: NAD(+) kinase, partial [Pseudomonadota bacterium]